jgi:hypothetical protein
MSDRINAVEGRLDRLAGRVYAQARRPVVDEQVRADTLDYARADWERAGVKLTEPVDPELEALLRLQAAPAPAPGTKG